MNIMNGINSFLTFINDNWTGIIIMVGLIVAVYQKIRNYVAKSDNEKIEIAKIQIKETILKLIADAEFDYEEWKNAGSIKRAQVIQEIYDRYPILEKVIDQQGLINWLDDQIDSALDILREIISKNKTAEVDGNS